MTAALEETALPNNERIDSPRGEKLWVVSRWVAGILLLTAAFFKAFSPQEAATLQLAYRIPSWVSHAFIQGEIALGCVLLFGLWQPWARRWAIVLFGIFSVFSLYRALSGAESCGCFGAVSVPPWWTFGVDLAVVALLGGSSIPGDVPRTVRSGLAIPMYIGLAAVCAFGGDMQIEPAEAKNPLIQKLGGLYLLEPENWVGETFPLGPYLSPAQPLEEGEWVVVLYHHDCPKCQEARPQYERLATRSELRVLLVEVPPYGPSEPAFDSLALHSRLRGDQEWFVQAPIEIRLTKGVVTSSSLDLPSLKSTPN